MSEINIDSKIVQREVLMNRSEDGVLRGRAYWETLQDQFPIWGQE